jgi:hypothetical protein
LGLEKSNGYHPPSPIPWEEESTQPDATAEELEWVGSAAEPGDLDWSAPDPDDFDPAEWLAGDATPDEVDPEPDAERLAGDQTTEGPEGEGEQTISDEEETIEPPPDEEGEEAGEEETIEADDEEGEEPEPEPETAFRKFKGGCVCPRLAALKDLFRKHYYFSDDNVIDVVLGVVAGNHFDSDPVWLHLIGPPSSGKTELLYSVFLCPETFFLSDLTPAALISGYKDPPQEGKPKKKAEPKKARAKGKGKASKDGAAPEGEKVEDKAPAAAAAAAEAAPEQEDYSLLPKLDGKVLVTKDFTVIHDKPAETRAQVLAILRDVYDGYASRGVGNGPPKGFFSRFNYLTGMTPDIERSWSLNTLGERFLMYRIRIADRHAHARRAILNAVGKGKGAAAARSEIQAAVKQFLEGVGRTTPEVGEAMIERILHLADVLSTCRTYVRRNKNDELICPAAPELAARVGKQLVRIGQGLALVRGRTEVGDEEFEVVRRIALDSLPSNRRRLLASLWRCRKQPLPVDRYAAHVAGLSKTTVRRELSNLAELGAVSGCVRKVVHFQNGHKFETEQYVYELSKDFRRSAEIVGGLDRRRS